MMCVFYRNLCSILAFCTLIVVAALPMAFAVAIPVATVVHAAPSTGLEGGQRHSYGPGVESKQEKRLMSGGMVDAYGNPIVPEEEERAPRERLRSGAYGGERTVSPELSRPLPDVPSDDTLWNF